MKTKEQQAGFVYYGLRISFWVMIAIWGLNAITLNAISESMLIVFVWIASILFCFVTSIIHLTKHKKKEFAVTSLVLSSYLILTLIIGFIIGFAIGMGAV